MDDGHNSERSSRELAEEFARWLSEQTGEPVRFEEVEPGAEQTLEDREQRELDAVPSFLALHDED